MSWSAWQPVEGDGLVFEEIRYEKKIHSELEGGIARVTIAKPDKYNVMTLSTASAQIRAASHRPSGMSALNHQVRSASNV